MSAYGEDSEVLGFEDGPLSPPPTPPRIQRTNSDLMSESAAPSNTPIIEGHVATATVLGKPSTLETVAEYLSSIGHFTYNYLLPEKVKESLPPTLAPQPEKVTEKDALVWAHFEWLPLSPSGENRLLLGMVYEDGFQVWDLTRNDTKQNAVEVANVRGTPYASIRILPGSVASSIYTGPLRFESPVVALTTMPNERRGGVSSIHFFSLRSHEIVHELEFTEPVLGVKASRGVLVVALKECLVGYSLNDFNELFRQPCYPHVVPRPVFALGTRWLAYPSTEKPPRPRSMMDVASHLHAADDEGGGVMGVAVDLASEVASGIMYLGDMGVKTVTNYLSPSSSPPSEVPLALRKSPLGDVIIPPEVAKRSGTVVVRDLETNEIVAHFRAHMQALTAMEFDPSGSLLATITDGHGINIFQIVPSAPDNDPPVAFRRIYKLKRGYTNADIQSITFSADSRWIAASSFHGTTHLFAINKVGGTVSTRTHLPTDVNQLPVVSFVNSIRNPYPASDLTLNPLVRIKHNFALPTQVASPSSSPNPGAAVQVEPKIVYTSLPLMCVFGPPVLGGRGVAPLETMFTLTPDGNVVYYLIRPYAGDPDVTNLLARIEPISSWDVCRLPSWEAAAIPLQLLSTLGHSRAVSMPEEKNCPDWLAHVEICTYEPESVPIWTLPQFEFQTYDTRNVDVPVAEVEGLEGILQIPEPIPMSRDAPTPDYAIPRGVLACQRESLSYLSLETRVKPPIPANSSHLVIEVDLGVLPSAPTVSEAELHASLTSAMDEQMPSQTNGN